MCSSHEQRIAEIGRAIDHLAAEASAVGPAAARRARVSDSEKVVARLAELWALLAELDPDIARRLPTYELNDDPGVPSGTVASG